MKLIFSIALVLGLMMLGEGIALGIMIALMIAFAVRLALPIHTDVVERIIPPAHVLAANRLRP